jgi:hypothetical protein
MLEKEGPETPLLDRSDAAVKELIRSAKKRGYVTHDQINALLSSDEAKSEQIEDILAKLSEMGVSLEAELEEEVATREEPEEEADGENELVEVQQWSVPAKSGAKEPAERPVSRKGFRIFWKPPTLPGFSRCTKRLSSTAWCKFRSQVPNCCESLRSGICHIRISGMETWFELSETGSKLDLSARNVCSLLSPRPIRPAGVNYGNVNLHLSRFIPELGPSAPTPIAR